MSDKDAGTGFVIGMLVGAVMGLAIGFLYSPQDGDESRKLLKERSAKVKERAANVVAKVKERAAEK